MRKQTHPNRIIRLDSEDERNVSETNESTGDVTDNVDPSHDQTDDKNSADPNTVSASHNDSGDFKKPLPPSNAKPIKRKHKKHNSNGNNVISRDDAMILVPDGVQQSDGFTFIRTPRGSDNENSDTEVQKKANASKNIRFHSNFI